MELRQLAHFVAVAEKGRFTKAACRAHIVQSGISASISALEWELGAQLINRARHAVELTVAGQIFLVEVRQALSAVETARIAVKSVTSALAGTLEIGVVSRLKMNFHLPGILLELSAAHAAAAFRVPS